MLLVGDGQAQARTAEAEHPADRQEQVLGFRRVGGLDQQPALETLARVVDDDRDVADPADEALDAAEHADDLVELLGRLLRGSSTPSYMPSMSVMTLP